MRKRTNRHIANAQRQVARFVVLVLLVTTIGAQPGLATTYMSVEPIPSGDVVGQVELTSILGIGYPNLRLWSNRLLNQCGTVQNVIAVLTEHGAITTVNAGNTSSLVAAGGFEGVTNPSFVSTIVDTGMGAASEADVNVLSNALGDVLNQSGTAHFSPDNAKAYDFTRLCGCDVFRHSHRCWSQDT